MTPATSPQCIPLEIGCSIRPRLRDFPAECCPRHVWFP
jgi:hypothetical protein